MCAFNFLIMKPLWRVQGVRSVLSLLNLTQPWNILSAPLGNTRTTAVAFTASICLRTSSTITGMSEAAGGRSAKPLYLGMIHANLSFEGNTISQLS